MIQWNLHRRLDRIWWDVQRVIADSDIDEDKVRLSEWIRQMPQNLDLYRVAIPFKDYFKKHPEGMLITDAEGQQAILTPIKK